MSSVQADEFITRVQRRARLDSREAAEQATRATLETLAERLGGDEPRGLAARLPAEIGEHLRRPARGMEPFSLQEFYHHVADRSVPGVDRPAAAMHARAVMSAVRDAVGGAALSDIVARLPEEYQPLFTADDLTAGETPSV